MTHAVATTLPPSAEAAQSGAEVFALLAEYDNVDAVTAAAHQVRDAGYRKWDVHTPFPIHGIDPSMGVRPTILPWIVLICGLTGGTLGIILTHYTMGMIPDWEWLPESFKGYTYPVAGKPFWSTPAYIPIIFEMTILISSLGAFFGMWILNKLPQLYSPLFKVPNFQRATDDRFFVVIETRDPVFDREKTEELLRSTRPLSLEAVDY